LSTRVIPLLQMFQFDSQDRCLERVETAVVAAEHVLIFFLLSVISQHPKAFRNGIVACYHHACVAVCTQILSGIKAERSSMPQGTRSFAFVAGAMCLASVFNNDQPMPLSQMHHRIHVSWMAVKVHR